MKHFNLIFLFLLSLACFSQKTDALFTKGELVKKSLRDLKIANVPDENEGLYTVKYRKKQAVIQHYNKELQIDIEYLYDLKDQTILSVYVLNNNLNFITYRVEKKTKQAFFNSNIFNSEKLTVKQSPIFNIPSKQIALKKKGLNLAPTDPDQYAVSNPFEGHYRWGFFSNDVINYLDTSGIQYTYHAKNRFQWGIKFSKNKKYYVIGFANFEEGRKNKKQHESYRFYFFNSKNEQVYNQVVTLDHKDQNYYFYDLEVDETSESFYFLGKHFPKGTGSAFKYPEYEYEIYRITKDASTSAKIDINNLKINDLNIHIGAFSNNIAAVGLFSNTSNYSAEGLAFFSFDKTNLAPISSTHTKFSEQFFKDSQNKKEKYNDFYIDNLHETTKGALFILGEERKTVSMGQSSAFDPFGTSYYYTDVLVSKLNLKGEIQWSRAVKKNQTTNSKDPTTYMSYTSYLSNKDEINVIFNASQNLKTLKNGNTLYDFSNFKKIVPHHLTFNKVGDYTSKELFSPEEKVILNISDFIYNNTNTPSSVFFLGQRVTKELWIKYKLE